jgi:hypothetical protein
MIFVLHYDRELAQTVSIDEFAEDDVARADAFRERLEDRFREQKGVEIVTLTSASRDTLRMTHSRYFLTDDELVSALERLIA